MKNNNSWLVRLILAVILALPLVTEAGELGERFREYKEALSTRDPAKIAAAAEVVYRVADKLPEDNKNYAAAAMNYGKALIDIHEYDKAELYLKKSVKSHRRAYGDKDARVIDPLLALARARAENVGHSDRYRYRNYIHDALEIAEASGGKQSPLYATVNLEAGKIALDSAKEWRALNYLDDAYQAFSGPLKDHISKRFLSALYLGKYYMARNQYKRAEPLLVEALQLIDGASDKDSQLELTTRAFLVEVYEELGQQEKSIEQCRAIGGATPFNMNQEPEPLFTRGLQYPPAALDSHAEGYAIARFTISDSGLAEDIEILETKGSSSFGSAAEKYLREARYAPRFVDGKPVSTPDRQIKFHFNMAD